MNNTNILGTIATCLAVFLIGAGSAPGLLSVVQTGSQVIGESLATIVASSPAGEVGRRVPKLNLDQVKHLLSDDPDLLNEVTTMLERNGRVFPKIERIKESRVIGTYEISGKNLSGGVVYINGNKVASDFTSNQDGKGVLIIDSVLAGRYTVVVKTDYGASKEAILRVK